MCDLVLIIETRHLLTGEVRPIVKNNGVGESEVAHYVLPKELENLLPSDFREWHCLDSFGEVVGGYQEES